MYPLISVEDAASQPWDVIVAGSSFAAMFFVNALPPDLRVLVVEKGKLHLHADELLDGRHTEEVFNHENRSDVRKDWVAHTQFGGNSNCWTGQIPRFLPEDFRMAQTHGIGLDWPIAYDGLEEIYFEVEQIMQANGGGSDHLIPRSRPFPDPAHVPSRSDVVLQEHSPDWFACPTARLRDLCCSNGVCHLCPLDAKFTILNGFARLTHPNTQMLLSAELREVLIENRTARGVLVRVDGAEVELSSDLVALGANAIFNAAILLRSGLSSDNLGRHLHEQNARAVVIDAPVKNYFGGTKITGHGYHFYANSPRDEAAAVMIENYNAPQRLRAEKGRWTERLRMKLVSDDLPEARNRVVLDAAGEPQILWHGHSQYSRDGMQRALDALPSILPFEIENMSGTKELPGNAHIQGTHRMGHDPASSVVDAGLKTHEVPNLLALGSGAFPTCSPANPTLTLSALSIHAARSL